MSTVKAVVCDNCGGQCQSFVEDSTLVCGSKLTEEGERMFRWGVECPCGKRRRTHKWTVTQRAQVEDALHFARKREQKVWGSGEHETARMEVKQLEAVLHHWPNTGRMVFT